MRRPRSQLELWRVARELPRAWLSDDVRDAYRNTAYALVGFALSMVAYSLVVPPGLAGAARTFAVAQGGSGVAFWLLGESVAQRVEGSPTYNGVWDALFARKTATAWTGCGLVASAVLVVLGLLVPVRDARTTYVLRVASLHLSVTSWAGVALAGGVIVVAFVATWVVWVLMRKASRRDFSAAIKFTVLGALAEKARTSAELAGELIDARDVDRWLERARAEGLVASRVLHIHGTSRDEMVWELTAKAKEALRAEGFEGQVHTRRDRRRRAH